MSQPGNHSFTNRDSQLNKTKNRVDPESSSLLSDEYPRRRSIGEEPETRNTQQLLEKIIENELAKPKWKRCVYDHLQLSNPKVFRRIMEDGLESFRIPRHIFQTLMKLEPCSIWKDVDSLDDLAHRASHEALRQNLNHSIQSLQERVDDRAQKLAAMQEQLAQDLKEQESVREDRDIVSGSLLRQASEYLDSFFWKKGSEETSDSVSNGSSKSFKLNSSLEGEIQQFQQLAQRIENAEKLINKQQHAIDRLNSQMRFLTDKYNSLPKPLTVKQFETARSSIESVMEDVCSCLGQHLERTHKKILIQHQTLDATTDLTRPQEWFPYARMERRKIIFHGGPTNSGKTYHALERLKEAKKGLYLGPLRLLAAEIYEKLNASGVYCNLYTGQEQHEVPFATHAAATVEMASAVDDFDILVIDEIQMIEDKDRGFAWTRALLGARCKEIHVCGGLEAEGILRRIADSCGDEFELRKYERFSPLKVLSRSLSKNSNEPKSYRNVRPGDCVVAFSRNDIFAIKREIESLTSYKCCVIYGSLPPQTRSEQARRFNDPESGYDVLVASDAIAMGLNLNIKRIIFNSIYKNDGSGIVRLGHSQIKQISGRAGRRSSLFPDGEVTCRDPEDLPYIRHCLDENISDISKAGLLPTANHIELFKDSIEKNFGAGNRTELHSVLQQFNDMASVRSDFFICRQDAMVIIAKRLKQYTLSIRDKFNLCMCPVMIDSDRSMAMLDRCAQKLTAGEVFGLRRDTIPRKVSSFEDLAQACYIFSELDLFLWLQRKFPPGNLMEQQAALARKELATRIIGEGLSQTEKLKLQHCYLKRDQSLRTVYDKSSQNTEETDDEDDWLL